MKPMSRSYFITFEGPEGGGKSTQIRSLARHLESQGRTVLCLREPGGTVTGDAIRKILQQGPGGEPIAPSAELLLFAASRAQLVERMIRPALARGDWVLCDRFFDSTTAYQGFGRGFDRGMLKTLQELATGGLKPDLTLLLDLDVRLGMERIHRRAVGSDQGLDRIECEKADFHERVRVGYLTLAGEEPGRFRVIAADREPERIEAEIWKVVADVCR
jgi:dTMP kinase